MLRHLGGSRVQTGQAFVVITGLPSLPHRPCGRRAASAVLACLLVALVTKAEPPPVASAPQAPIAASPAASDYRAPENPRELLVIDPAMRRYFAARIDSGLSEYDRLCRLTAAIIDPNGLNFIYSAGNTSDPRETFRRRRGNCVSYAFLVVAVARAFGFEARFQSMDRDARWDRFGDVIITARHLDVRVTLDDGGYIIDPEPSVANGNWSVMRVVSDTTAFSQFYSNVGVEHLVHGRIDEARRCLTLATQVDPKYAPAWSNLAMLHARDGDLQTARAEFERSLKLDPRGDAALDGFVTILRRLASPDDLRQADKLERRARRIRARNPYRQQAEALLCQQRGDLAGAEKLYRRAIRLKNDDPQFYVQWIAVLEQLGRVNEAQHARRKLEKLRARLGDIPIRLEHPSP